MLSSPRKPDGSTNPTQGGIVGTIRLSSTAKQTNGPSKESPKSLEQRLQDAVRDNARTIFLTQRELNQAPWLARLPNGELFYLRIPVKLGKPGYLLPDSTIKPLFDEVVYADGYSHEVRQE